MWHRRQPKTDSDTFLQTLIESEVADASSLGRPVVLRSTALQRQEALEGYHLPQRVDGVLRVAELLIVVALAAVAYLFAQEPINAWLDREIAAPLPLAESRPPPAPPEPTATSQPTPTVPSQPTPRRETAQEIAPATKTAPARRPRTAPTRQPIGAARVQHPELGFALPSIRLHDEQRANPGRDAEAYAPVPDAALRALDPAALEPQAPEIRDTAVHDPVPDAWMRAIDPATLEPQASQATGAPTPQPTAYVDRHPVHLLAPAAQIDTPVVEVFLQDGVWQVAEYAAGYLHGTGIPGEGNAVLAGHKGILGAVFARLEQLKRGDEIFVDAAGARYRYRVRATGNVWPSQVEVLYPTEKPVLTLLTCTNWDMQRFVVVADLVDSSPLVAGNGG